MLHTHKLAKKLIILAALLIALAACSSKEYAERLHYSASPAQRAAADTRDFLIDFRMEEKTNYNLFLLAQTAANAKEALFVADPRSDAADITSFETAADTGARIPGGRSVSFDRALPGKSDGIFKLAAANEEPILLSARLFAKSRAARHEEAKLYNYSVAWPEFVTPDKALNTAINAAAAACAQSDALSDFIEASKSETARDANDPEYWFETGYTITLYDARFVSVLFLSSIYTGGAHPNHWTGSITFAIDGARQLAISDIIRDDSYGDLVPLVRGKLREQGASWTEEIVLEDTTFSLAPGGVCFWFDPYQAGSYAEGLYRVFFAWKELQPFLAAEMGTLAETGK